MSIEAYCAAVDAGVAEAAERGEALVRGLAIRDEADPAGDLASFPEITLPRERWAAVRDYLRELRAELRAAEKRSANRLALVADFQDHVLDVACERVGSRPRSTASKDFLRWLVATGAELLPSDHLIGRMRALAPLRGKVRDAAALVLKPYMPEACR